MSDLLAEMAASSQARVASAAAVRELTEVRELALARPAPPRPTWSRFDLIAEVKLRAPSAGRLAPPGTEGAWIAERAARYADAGAAVLSVLTEPLRFDGDLAHLEAAAGAVAVPAMRKDFLVDPYQVWEARLHGAGGVLLITRMLSDGALHAMLDAASEAGLFALVECFDDDDVGRSAAALAGRRDVLIGVNSRDLRSLEVVPDRLRRLADRLPGGIPWVAESGLDAPEDAARVARWGYAAALVGSALMRRADPTELVTAMLAAGREAACS